MKILLGIIISVFFSACGVGDEESQHKFAIRQKAEQITYHYARYRFELEDYEDVEVALKLMMKGGAAMILWIKDLTDTDNKLEEAVLNNMGGHAFAGASGGVLGGVYTGTLELNSIGAVSGCCGQMTFAPAVDNSLLFVGTKLEVLTAARWKALISGELPTTTTPPTPPTVPEVPDLPEMETLALGTKRIGKVFSIGVSAAIGEKITRLEAYNGAGSVVGALAQWKANAGDDIFAVHGSANLFLTGIALSEAITALHGFDKDGNKLLEASITAAARDNAITVHSEYYTLGNYTWIAFSENPNPVSENAAEIKDKHQNSYLNLKADNTIHDYHSGHVSISGRDGRGFWVGMPDFNCAVGNRLMARVLDNIYHGTCNEQDSWW